MRKTNHNTISHQHLELEPALSRQTCCGEDTTTLCHHIDRTARFRTRQHTERTRTSMKHKETHSTWTTSHVDPVAEHDLQVFTVSSEEMCCCATALVTIISRTSQKILIVYPSSNGVDMHSKMSQQQHYSRIYLGTDCSSRLTRIRFTGLSCF